MAQSSDNFKDEKLSPINLGWLDVRALHRLGLNFLPGQVVFSIAAQKHAKSGHPDDYYRCLALMPLAVRSPTYVGQEPKHEKGGFELIYESTTEDYVVLVAIKMERREDGTFAVSSTYPINKDTLERRLRKGFVKRAQ